MVRRQALFAGDSELQQLLHIFRLLGTPNEELWPGVSKFRDWHEYPEWAPQNIARAVPTLESTGVDLLSVIFSVHVIVNSFLFLIDLFIDIRVTIIGNL